MAQARLQKKKLRHRITIELLYMTLSIVTTTLLTMSDEADQTLERWCLWWWRAAQMCNHPAHLQINVFRLEIAMPRGQHVLPTGCEKSLPSFRYILLLGFHKIHKQMFRQIDFHTRNNKVRAEVFDVAVAYIPTT